MFMEKRRKFWKKIKIENALMQNQQLNKTGVIDLDLFIRK